MASPSGIPQLYQEQADLFRMLGHPVRLAILSVLSQGKQCVCHIEAMLGLRQSYISQHLMTLREAGLVEDLREGWNIYYRITTDALPGISALLGSGVRGAPRAAMARAGRVCHCPKCSASRTGHTESAQRRGRGPRA